MMTPVSRLLVLSMLAKYALASNEDNLTDYMDVDFDPLDLKNTKIPVTLDISKGIPKEVAATLSVGLPISFTYIIKPGYRRTHRIGKIADDDEVIIEDNEMNSNRFAFYFGTDSGREYIRVFNVISLSSGSIIHIDEFSRETTDLVYKRIFRKPVDLDLLSQNYNELINVSVLSDTNHTEGITGCFTIKPEASLSAIIGAVSYGGYTIEDRVDGLIYRKVIWEGGLNNPKITIISRYNDSSETKQTFVRGEQGFILLI
ncbi:signal peptide containing protein [Theileria equi strain WA]|uniref:Signal peptide containing protein n=1 Tax=Theileria equi strain WA TaxID=1537102 RepID=L1LDE4_THEEQ|nr:signal peptide containing protein [Theileria equi strain WA]EKX73366.1 signal peptide containing protein [Theileria equi strain WA]|eukprot:XP_004832818.1 signal peptide containing protein [Theileria equi strain WA]